MQLTTKQSKNLKTESKGDITLIFDEESQEPVALNIFNAASYVKINAEGPVELTEAVLAQIESALAKNNVEVEFDVDLTPKFVVGHVLKKESHPNADKLSICTVDVGSETLQIVCGAFNVEKGQKVVVAKVGAVMPSGMVIHDAELRGVASSGMICSAIELGLPNAEKGIGILVLEQDVPIGQAFS